MIPQLPINMYLHPMPTNRVHFTYNYKMIQRDRLCFNGIICGTVPEVAVIRNMTLTERRYLTQILFNIDTFSSFLL